MWILSTLEPGKAVMLGTLWCLAYVQGCFAALKGVHELRAGDDLFTIPPAEHRSSCFSTSTPTLVILLGFLLGGGARGLFFVCLFVLLHFVGLFGNRHPNEIEVPPPRGFDLHLAADYSCSASFHGLIGHLHTFFAETSSQVLCQLFNLSFFLFPLWLSHRTSSCVQDFNLLSDRLFGIIFIHSTGCLGTVLIMSFEAHTF